MAAVPQQRPIGDAIRRRRAGALIDTPIEWSIRATALLTIVILAGILTLLLWQGLQLFVDRGYSVSRFLSFPNAITDNTTDPTKFRFGIVPPLVATLWVTLITLVVAVPLGMATAVFISEVAPPRIRLVIKSIAELLAGVPTVVFAFVGLALVAPKVREVFGWGVGGLSGFTAGIVVAFVAVPLIISIADDALQAVPRDLRESAYALGSNKLEVTFFVVMPAAISGLTAAVMLGMARAIGETMVVLILAGGNSSLPATATESMRPMTATIASGFGNATTQSLIRPALFMTGAVLFLLTFVTTLLADLVLERQRRKFGR
jgi:phosphate transport system permease protein